MPNLALLAAFLLLSLPEKFLVSAVNSTAPALIVFGDSIVDAANNNALPGTLTKCNFPPYGRDFDGQAATGRFSNGKIINDIIVSEMGITQYLPAYLDPNLQEKDLLTGVTFASGGSGFDDLTANSTKVLSISAQLEFFKEYQKKLVAFAGQERADYIISHAQYMVVNGNNDIWNTYLFRGLRKEQYDFPSYADFLVGAASEFIKVLRTKGCCGTGKLEVSYLCNKFTPFTCKDASKYIFWDNFHPTEAAGRILVSELIKLLI